MVDSRLLQPLQQGCHLGLDSVQIGFHLRQVIRQLPIFLLQCGDSLRRVRCAGRVRRWLRVSQDSQFLLNSVQPGSGGTACVLLFQNGLVDRVVGLLSAQPGFRGFPEGFIPLCLRFLIRLLLFLEDGFLLPDALGYGAGLPGQCGQPIPDGIGRGRRDSVIPCGLADGGQQLDSSRLAFHQLAAQLMPAPFAFPFHESSSHESTGFFFVYRMM